MDSVSGYAGPHQPRSGGKTVRLRRTAIVRTPYDRPATRSGDSPQQNPSWISRLVKPASVIASGAGKFISSVVFSESSSSSSEDDEDSGSDVDGDEDVEKNFTENETMDLVNAQQPPIQRLSSKRVIEQLLMQETFAREEGDRLINIIKARVVDHPSVPPADEGRHSDTRLTSANVDERSTKAVVEARKWLEEKKSGSTSKNRATEDGAGSPADVAKSYMRARLPWGSPAANNSEFRSPSLAGMQLFKEGTPYPYKPGNFSSSKLKRRTRSNQSWNIQDEIRKVRAKATEEMLKSGSPAVRNEQSGVLPNSTMPTSEQNQTTETNQAAEETGVKLSSENTNTSGTGVDDDFIQPSSGDVPNAVLALGATLDPTGNLCIPKDVFETLKEADETGAAHPTSNGFPSSSPSSPVAMEGQAKPKPPGDGMTVGNGSENAIDNENNDSEASGSHNSSSTHEEEWLPGDQSLPNSNSASSSPGVSAYTRKGRGRGRGRGRGGRGKGRAK